MQELFQEKDLFRGYEVRNWDFSPMIYKILAASALINIVGLAIFSQTNLLTKKGCDSPFVSTVCEVLDTIYVGNKLFGTDGDYVVKEYNKTDIGEDDEITFIDVANISPPIAYPPGYFALANPEQYTVDANGLMVKNNGFENITPGFPGIPENSSPLTNSTPSLPAPNLNPLKGKVDDSPWSIVNDPTQAGKGKKGGKNPTLKNDSPTELPKFDGDETAENKTDVPKIDPKSAQKSDPVKEVEINKKPLQDFADTILVKTSVNAKEKLDLTQPFKVVLDGYIKPDGKLDSGKSKFPPVDEKEAGNGVMVKIAKDALMAVGDSGFLGYLENFGAKKVKITMIQDGTNISVLIESEQKSAELASTMAKGFGFYLSYAPKLIKGEDEKLLVSKVKPPTSNGKMFIVNVEIPKDVAQEMINRKLKEAQLKKEEEERMKKQNPNNSTATTFNSNTNSGK
jgi:hypothetical protein